MSNYVGGSGYGYAKLMVIGEAPGEYEDKAGEPFVGPTGREVQSLLQAGGMQWGQVYRTNVVKYRPPDNNLKRLHEIGHTIEEGLPQLKQEIETVKPNAILALGNLALKYLTGKQGIVDHRGSILPCVYGPQKVVASIHPSAYLVPRGDGAIKYNAKTYIRLDFMRAIEESRYPEFRLPQRNLQIARSSLDVERFFEQYKNYLLVAIDIEVIKCVPVCVSFAFTPSHALSVPLLPLTDLNNPFTIPTNDLASVWRAIAKLFKRPGLKVVGQNFKFDQEKLERPCGFVLPPLQADLMFMAHTLHPELPKSLGFLCSIYTKEPFYKDEGREFNPAKDRLDKFLLYNAKDSAVTIECYEAMLTDLKERKLDDFALNYTSQLHRLYMKLERNGFRVNEQRRQEMIAKYTTRVDEREKELFDLISYEVNVNSPKQVAILLWEHLKLPRRASTDEDTIVALLANNAKNDEQKRALNAIIDIRRLKKVVGILKTPADYDGCCRTSYRIVGTETGRSSTSKLEPPVRPEKLGFPFQTMSKHGDIGGDIRTMYEAPVPGWEILEIDLSQAEARIVALLSEDYDLLKAFDSRDVHRMTANWFFGVGEDKITEDMRFVGKIGRHGGNYDMGKHRLMMEINSNARRFNICPIGSKEPLNVSEWRAGQISDKFHANSSRIRGVFHHQVREKLKKDRTLVNPFGRERQFMARMDEDMFKEGYAYIPQSTVADIVKHAWIRIDEQMPALAFLSENHDAFVVAYPPEQRESVARLLVSELEKPIDFSRCSLSRGQLTIPTEMKVGMNYGELKKYKLPA